MALASRAVKRKACEPWRGLLDARRSGPLTLLHANELHSGVVGEAPVAKKQQGITYDCVRRLGLALPHVEEGTSYGTPALKVKGKLFVRLREEGDVVVLRMPLDLRDGLIADDPATYFFTDHYRDYPCVLVRLRKVTETAMRELLQISHRAAASSKNSSTKSRG